MSPTFVVDASIALAWCYTDEATPETTALLDRLTTEAALVPSHWHLEVANSLTTAERRGRIDRTALNEFISLLQTLEIIVDDETASRAFSQILPLASDYRLSVYDAAYLDLARRSSLSLASLDLDLRNAANSIGVELLGQ